MSIEQAIGLIKIAKEQKFHDEAIIKNFYYRNITIERCNQELLALDTIIDICHLARIFDDHKLAQWIGKKLRLTLTE